MPGCSDAGTNFLPTGCSNGTADAAATEETASDTAVLTLMLVTLLELLRWVSLVARTTTIPRLRSTNLAFPVLHLPTLRFCHDCSVYQVLEGGEGVAHQLIMEGINQSS